MMRSSVWLVVAGLWLVHSAVGCSKEDSKGAPGSEGESCARRSDCSGGLLCINQVCQRTPEMQEMTQPLGGVGESCTRRADCASGLSCIGNVCAMGTEAIVSQEGETCGARSDCAEGLACIANECTTPGSVGPSGGRGESCRTTDDCEPPLACMGLTCLEADYEIEHTNSECVQVECDTPTDCCPEPYVECETWASECAMGAGGANIYCEYYENPTYNCVCDSSAWSCENFQCEAEVVCDTDLDCTFGVCLSGVCVTCAVDEDCLVDGQECVNNECVGACKTDTECPVFHVCQDGGCVEQGCQDDRECIALTGNIRSSCDQGECREPCEHDADCFTSPLSQVFNFSACQDGFCEDVGCKTDQECKIRMNLTGNTAYEARCVDRGM